MPRNAERRRRLALYLPLHNPENHFLHCAGLLQLFVHFESRSLPEPPPTSSPSPRQRTNHVICRAIAGHWQHKQNFRIGEHTKGSNHHVIRLEFDTVAAAQTLPIRGHFLALHANAYGEAHLQYVSLVGHREYKLESLPSPESPMSVPVAFSHYRASGRGSMSHLGLILIQVCADVLL